MKNLDKGIYILELFAEREFTIAAKKFIGINFPKGYYYYIGSAQKSLSSRIGRHLRKEKIIHWHIDHITTHKSIKLNNIFTLDEAEKNIEAKIANSFVEYFDAQIIVKGFGNSDTKETITHLFYKNQPIPFSEFNIFYNNQNSFKIQFYKKLAYFIFFLYSVPPQHYGKFINTQ